MQLQDYRPIKHHNKREFGSVFRGRFAGISAAYHITSETLSQKIGLERIAREKENKLRLFNEQHAAVLRVPTPEIALLQI